ncbi:hypothetical protein KUV85_03885 [Nocardioides panacisoli]|uniref:hypothetical protein n=1 Tax=Nocardioides panacisoli TaxID=627624 RepID=UPI001C63B095|nr:hypothetical protein [Nocardioides panacisoli]QYJ04834.1 hypothetical protein KUV85_03885 [Nocardioides panacisoli]
MVAPVGAPAPRTWRYEFLLGVRVSDTVRAAFPELTATTGAAGGTVFFGEVEDDAHLHGILARFQTLGLSVLEMRRLPD